jgi:quercetin dioxygenase-like cupin family protein
LLHRHHHDYLSVNLGPAQISNQVEGKPPVTAKLQDGQTAFGQAPLAHVVRDLAATPFRNVTIEFLQDDKAHRAPSAPWDEERGLHILEGGTQHIMFVQDGVRVSEVDLQPGGMVPKHHHSGPHLLVAVTDLELENDVAGKGTLQINLKAGDIKWVPGGFTHTLMNAGKQPAKFVILEFR